MRIVSTLWRGLRLASGSWKTICMSCRIRRSFSPLEGRDVGAVEDDRARGDRHEPQHRPAERRLAAAGLAHQAEGLALVDVEVDAVDRLDGSDLPVEDQPGADREVHLEAPRDRRSSARLMASPPSQRVRPAG